MAYEIGQTCMLFNLGLSRGECASWVQAWGSLLAVVGGAIGIWWQVRKQAQLRTEDLHRIGIEREQAAVAEEVRRLHVIAGTLFQCIIALKRIEAASRSRLQGEVQLQVAALGRLVELLGTIPALEVPDVLASVAIAEAQSIFGAVETQVAKANGAQMVGVAAADAPHERRAPHIEQAILNFIDLEKTLRTALHQRGSDLPAQTAFLNGKVLHTTQPES